MMGMGVMLRLAPYALSGALVAALWWSWADSKAKGAEIARLQGQVAVIERQAAQAKEARVVADAEATRHRVKSEELDNLKETLLRGHHETPIPDWFADYLDSLFNATGPIRNSAH